MADKNHNCRHIPCSVCSEPITGEPGVLCGCEDEGCEGCGRAESWAPGCWYLDGETYTCGHCGAVHKATIDEQNGASLDIVDATGAV